MEKTTIGQGSRQRGAALIVGLVFLMVLTLVALSSMTSSSMQEKMAGNMRDQSMAFQAAEAAVREAERFIDSIGTKGTAGAWNGSGGLYGPSDSDPDYYDSASWSGSQSKVTTDVDLNTFKVKSEPRYIVKYVGEVQPEGGTARTGGYGTPRPPPTSIFRITARGTGGSDNAVVIIQSHFGRRF